ncbi:ComF family protein [Salirhabdus salicampi]|uniref:ComF family protein n=1 Tax=Salirhabdus salicampi TaxID=476102 RepID=UPI0020C207DA|nr:ComF family protein [Salirhabdus salicampi]MCP8617593.1 ComF family protein [Salirhabdus salicampi]
MRCLWCFDEVIPSVTWTTFIHIFEEQYPLCNRCKNQLERIDGIVCHYCYRPQSKRGLCSDCERWKRNRVYHNVLKRNISLFTYNDFMKEVMARWKYRGDYALVYMFDPYVKNVFQEELRQFNGVLVPIPLSEERYDERGFNQAEAICRLVNKPVQHLLRRGNNEKQAKKGRRERLNASNPFQLTKATNYRSVLLVDDIYTTGVTLHKAARVLRDGGVKEIISLTIVRS